MTPEEWQAERDEKRRKSQRDRYAARKAFMDETKAFLGCFICGDEKVHRLEWHHLTPRRGKGRGVSTALSCGGVEQAMEEMKKCVLLCANCHKDVHEMLESCYGD